jgi:UDP-N-acetylmuramoyl-L-alanyl-D-glutamate--2,6-diaminopimelate ligase
VKKIISQKIKNIYHFFQALLANICFDFPGKKIKVIGVTGTNGKTTTVQMIGRILEESGAKIAVASTINFKINEKEWINKTKFTTLNSWKTLAFLNKAIKAGCKYLVLEVGSHALDQFRVWGIKFDIAVITNVTREHLDYHRTMKKYRQAKLKLFKKARVAIVNLDMKDPQEFLQFKNEKKYGYTTQVQNSNEKFKIIQAKNIRLKLNNTKYYIRDTRYLLNIPGMFNVENALAATCVGLEYGILEEEIKRALEKIKGVAGRLESISNSLDLNIIIDYAVTPDSLEKLYDYLSKIKGSGKIISVFGSCGERDRGKRPIMGGIVEKMADYIILTNEDPYHEDPWQIINEVAKGIKNKEENKNFWKILDRRKAIVKALNLARASDTIIITGKGAEETMAIGKKRIPWNDKKVILEELEKFKKAP